MTSTLNTSRAPHPRSPTQPTDISGCDGELIHIPSAIQPHGVLLVLRPKDLTIVQASRNTDAMLGREVDRLLGATLEQAIGGTAAAQLKPLLNGNVDVLPVHLRNITIEHADERRLFHAIAHRTREHIVLELEELQKDSPAYTGLAHRLVNDFLDRIGIAANTEQLCLSAAREVRKITRFDRVMVYRFDDQWNGTVIAEDRNDALPSYQGLRFPASDIPRQARELYRLNRLRLIPDAQYTPVPLEPVINPDTHQPLDMSYCLLRSVSPVHTQYMKNMGTAASISISIIRGGELWGLISCHNAAPATVPAEVRMACDFLGQILSLQIAAREHAAEFERRIRTKSMQTALLSFMAAEDDYLSALAKHPDDLMQLTNARGVALATHAQVTLLGLTPSEPQVRRIMRWLESEVQQTVYATDALGLEMEDGAELTSTAAGMLAVSLSRVRPCYLLWFRPEVVQTVAWGGDPRKPVEEGKADQLSPRSSFELWKETVRDHAEPWQAVEIEAAEDLRSAVVNIVPHNAEEKAELTAELEITNRELESFSYSVSHDLRAPFRHITGFSELLMELEHERLSETGKRYLNAIVESAQYAGLLVDHLLAFSRMNREALTLLPLDMNMLVAEVQRELERETRDRRVRFIIGDLPTVTADLMMMRLVVQNLLSNAVKYTRPREEAVIEVGCRAEDEAFVFWVKDNGIGFDMQYVDKLFGVFQRLHRMEDFEGTGIGLANVRRIVERHNGRAWAEEKINGGATFYFSLPRRAKEA